MVKDEVSKCPIQLYSFYGGAKEEKFQNDKRLLNMGLSFAHLSDLCSIYTPLSYKHFQTNQNNRFNNWNHDPKNLYHSSALFAAGIDMTTKPTRTIGAQFSSMSSIVSTMVEMPQRNICSMEISFPFLGSDIINLFDAKKYSFAASPYLFPLTPNMSKDPSVSPFSSIISLFGVENQSTRHHFNLTPKEMLSNYCSSSRKQCFSYEKPFNLPISFPKFFDQSVNSVQSLAHLQNTQQQYYNIKLLADALSKIDVSKHHEFQLNNVEHQMNIEMIAKKSDLYAKKNFD